jgi:hypothetical protein
MNGIRYAEIKVMMEEIRALNAKILQAKDEEKEAFNRMPTSIEKLKRRQGAMSDILSLDRAAAHLFQAANEIKDCLNSQGLNTTIV